MRSIQVFGKEVTGWQVLPADAKDFEEAALRACELVLAGDPRIGKAWSAARLEIGRQAGSKFPEAGEATQHGRERPREASSSNSNLSWITFVPTHASFNLVFEHSLAPLLKRSLRRFAVRGDPIQPRQ
jgi:hypothetical protein